MKASELTVRRAASVAVVGLALVGMMATPGFTGPDPAPGTGTDSAPGTVLTFYGLRQLEQDPNVPDDEKVKAWTAFVERSTQQVEYARKAMQRWREAGKLRVIETARLAETNDAFSPRQKVAQWSKVVAEFPGTAEATQARERILYWTSAETRRLVTAAESVEKEGRPKVDRIQSWMQLTAWEPNSREAEAARRRVAALQNQLYKEAESIQAIDRLDVPTKLAVWRDVLAGNPTAAQRKRAEEAIKALEAPKPK